MLILITGRLVKSAGTGIPNTQKCRMKNFSCDKQKIETESKEILTRSHYYVINLNK